MKKNGKQSTRPDEEKVRLLFVVNVDWFFVSHRLVLARAALNAGFEVHVACRAEDESAVKAIQREGCIFHNVDIARGFGGVAHEVGTLMALYRIFRSVKPHIVHNVGIKPVLYGTFLGRIAGIGWTVNAITGLGHVFMAKGLRASVRRGLVRLGYRFLLRNIRGRLIFQNPDDMNGMVAAGIVRQERAVLIRGAGVDLDLFTPKKTNNPLPVVLLPARMLKEKGVYEFLQAARLLRDRGISASYVLAGRADPGSPSHIPGDELQSLAAAAGVTWLGHVDDVAGQMSNADVVCLPSYGEGVPKSLIEAAACGKPIVTTDVPGCREVVTDGVNGLLVPVKDPGALATALSTLLGDPELRARYGANSRQRAENEFSVQSVMASTMAVYQGFREQHS